MKLFLAFLRFDFSGTRKNAGALGRLEGVYDALDASGWDITHHQEAGRHVEHVLVCVWEVLLLKLVPPREYATFVAELVAMPTIEQRVY